MSSTKIAGGDLRRVILDCALQLGEELGENGMTMRNLARRLGINQAVLYSAFEHKAELMSELAGIAVQRLDDWLAQASAQPEEPLACLFELCIAEAQFARRHPWLYKLAFDRGRVANVDLPADHPFVRRAAALLERARSGNSALRPVLDARQLCIAIHGMTCVVDPFPRQREFLERYVGVLLRALFSVPAARESWVTTP